MNRREFMELAGGFAALSAMQGCASGRFFGGATAMSNFAVPPMEKIRIGYIGIGERGTWAVHRVSGIPVTETAALCVKHGADYIVAGNSIFGAPDPAKALKDIRDACN